MTKQQKIYYDAIKGYIHAHGCSPTLQEVAELVGVRSLASVHRVVHCLVDDGYLVKDPNHTIRNLHVVPDKLDGFNYCDRAHEGIYFQSTVCPLCKEIQRRVQPREVRVG